jgi:hypothetical protein
MIKGLMGSTNVIVSGGNTSVPYISQNNNNPMQGMIRVWGSDMQVFDGNTWMTMSTSYATVDLSPEAQTLLQWAREQKARHAEREDRIKKNPALQKAWENIRRAEENFDLIDNLVKDYIEGQDEKLS